MGKYDPLSARLADHPGPEWRASFAELEEVLGFPLPKGARTGQAWWKNDGPGPHAKAWTGGGWHAGDVDHVQGLVTFRKTAAPSTPATALVTAPGEEPPILKRLEVSPKWGMALLAGSAALVVGLGALAVRGLRRRS